jgi:hypothetical protein
MSSTHRHLLLDFFWQVISGPPCIIDDYIGDNAVFLPDIWASDSHSMTRTTNTCELFHSRFSSNFYCTHSNLYQSTDILLNFQSENYVKIISVIEYFKKLRPHVKKRQHYLEKNCDNLKKMKFRSDFVKCGFFLSLLKIL